VALTLPLAFLLLKSASSHWHSHSHRMEGRGGSRVESRSEPKSGRSCGDDDDESEKGIGGE
jgi:hypothetical protein